MAAVSEPYSLSGQLLVPPPPSFAFLNLTVQILDKLLHRLIALLFIMINQPSCEISDRGDYQITACVVGAQGCLLA